MTALGVLLASSALLLLPEEAARHVPFEQRVQVNAVALFSTAVSIHMDCAKNLFQWTTLKLSLLNRQLVLFGQSLEVVPHALLPALAVTAAAYGANWVSWR